MFEEFDFFDECLPSFSSPLRAPDSAAELTLDAYSLSVGAGFMDMELTDPNTELFAVKAKREEKRAAPVFKARPMVMSFEPFRGVESVEDTVRRLKCRAGI